MKKLKSIKSLKNKAYALWKEIVFQRDGHECWVARCLPEIQIAHTDIIQVDHCFTRSNKHLFFDPRNGTPVCSACNQAKHYDQKGVRRAIDEIVTNREGYSWFELAKALDKSKSANSDFSKRWWLAETIEKLEKQLEEMKK